MPSVAVILGDMYGDAPDAATRFRPLAELVVSRGVV